MDGQAIQGIYWVYSYLARLLSNHWVLHNNAIMYLQVNTDFPFFYTQFYTSWCEHSRIAEPEFLQALQMLADSNVTSMFIGKIDVTKHGGKIELAPENRYWK